MKKRGVFVVAALPFVFPAASFAQGPAAVVTDDASSGMSTIVVTAQKRSEKLLSVPVPVTVVNAQDLINSNQLQLQDYYSKIPGLAYTPDFRGSAVLAIRGLAPQGTFGPNPTVGVVVDDVPFGPSTGWAGGPATSEIDPSDVASVEVLRGPQGTLYGANSIGGLLKYVTVDPSTKGFSGDVRVGTSFTYAGKKPGYDLHGAVNVAVTPTLAVRVSAFKRRSPGYIDNILTGKKDNNYVDGEGLRAAALWKPSDNISLKISALLQETKSPGSSYLEFGTGLGGFRNSDLGGTRGFKHKVQAYSAALNVSAGNVDLVSLTGYSVDKTIGSNDYSPLYGPAALHLYGVGGVGYQELRTAEKFTQEIRASTAVTDHINWMVGLYYGHEKGGQKATLYFADTPSGMRVTPPSLTSSSWADFLSPITTSEYAAFTNLTVRFSDRFDIQIGARLSQYKQSLTSMVSGPFVPLAYHVPSPFFEDAGTTKEHSFTYLVTPRFKLSQNIMIYARLASGYRPGGGNFAVPGVPRAYGADKTQNYEIGAKGKLFNGALTFDTSLYWIKWSDMQISLRDATNTTSYVENAGSARSRGIELSIDAKPLKGLNISGWVALNDAELTKNFPATSTAFGLSGDQLPYTSHLSGSMTVRQDVPLSDDIKGFVEGSVSYVDKRKDVFTASAAIPRLKFPSYTKFDMRAGINKGSWSLNFYVNNVTNTKGIVSGGYGPGATFVYLIRPRTVGMSLSKRFD